ncbi:unnamed protein product [Allacma fusca]|uniref:Ribosomal protein L27 n=1 Tax=Allacma fusca TaxID=39272 RepID=A0A8J2NZP6_9HEXA|nr:unnamed protein product [Allacma fusca]
MVAQKNSFDRRFIFATTKIRMNSLLNLSRTLGLTPNSPFNVAVRNASKKASGGKRNPKQGDGPRWSIKKGDGCRIFAHDIIVTQGRLRYHPGLNVVAVGSFQLRALKEGTVRFTCEQSNMNYSHSWIKKFYPETQGTPIFKKRHISKRQRASLT